MAAPARLSRLLATFIGETDSLSLAFACPRPSEKAIALRWPDVSLNASEGCVVRLYDSWNRFCRELVLTSAALRPISASGIVVAQAPNISSVSDVLPTVLAGLKKHPPFGEPRWADAKECIDAAKILKLSNYSTVSAGLGATPSPADDIKSVRNFVARRNQRTAKILRNITSAYGALDAHVEGLMRHLINPGLTVFANWIEELRTLAEASIQ